MVAGGAAAAPATPAASAAVPGAPLLRIATRGASWIGVQDGQGRTLLSRTVQAGETLALDGAPPLRVRIGNVQATELTFRGQPVPLNTRDNVARLELQ